MKAANFTTAEWSKALSTHIINSLLHVCQTYLYNLTMNEKKQTVLSTKSIIVYGVFILMSAIILMETLAIVWLYCTDRIVMTSEEYPSAEKNVVSKQVRTCSSTRKISL